MRVPPSLERLCHPVVPKGAGESTKIPPAPLPHPFEGRPESFGEGGLPQHVRMGERDEHPPGQTDVCPQGRQPGRQLAAEDDRHALRAVAQGAAERRRLGEQWRQLSFQQPTAVTVDRRVRGEQIGEDGHVSAPDG